MAVFTNIVEGHIASSDKDTMAKRLKFPDRLRRTNRKKGVVRYRKSMGVLLDKELSDRLENISRINRVAKASLVRKAIEMFITELEKEIESGVQIANRIVAKVAK